MGRFKHAYLSCSVSLYCILAFPLSLTPLILPLSAPATLDLVTFFLLLLVCLSFCQPPTLTHTSTTFILTFLQNHLEKINRYYHFPETCRAHLNWLKRRSRTHMLVRKYAHTSCCPESLSAAVIWIRIAGLSVCNGWLVSVLLWGSHPLIINESLWD